MLWVTLIRLSLNLCPVSISVVAVFVLVSISTILCTIPLYYLFLYYLATPTNTGSPVAILSSHYDDMFRQLESVDRISEYLYNEDVFTRDQLERIVTSASSNKREMLFTSLESAVTRDSSYLNILATGLQQDSTTLTIGRSLHQQYSTYLYYTDIVVLGLL